jgi:hypothetical protein
MKKLGRYLFGLCVVVAFSFTAAAQDKSQGNMSARNVLQITREFTKPGKNGMAHDKTESAFIQAMGRAKWPTHYLAMTSLSGKSRALFFTWYDSFEAWEKDADATAKNAELSAGIERAMVADGELLDSVDQGVFTFNQEMSLRPMADISHMRYLEISTYHVRPGRNQEWREVVGMVKAAYEKAVPSAHWGVYELRYGGDGGDYLVLTARKTLAELDRGPEESKDFAAAIGADGMKKLNEIYGASVESSQHQLFAFNPRMSYVSDEWIKADPDFWKPKAAAAPTAKPAKEGTKVKP